MKKKLYRSTKERIIAGVCGGIAEYFDVDPTLIRLLWILIVLLGGVGIIAYIIASIIIPKNPEEVAEAEGATEGKEDIGEKVKKGAKEVIDEVKERFESGGSLPETERNRRILGGIIIIVIGLIFLLNSFFPWFGWGGLWPLVLIALGIIIIIQSSKKK